MIISHEHEFIFLKTRKTAGTSIEILLSRYCGERDVITPISPEDEKAREKPGHRGAQNFRVPLLEHTPEGWVRLLTQRKRDSYYNHISAEEVRSIVGARVWKRYFKFCFERNPWDKAVSFYFWQTRRRKRRPTLLEFLRSEDVRYLSNYGIYSISGEIAVDNVGLYEDLDAEFERIAAHLNLPKDVELPRAKGSFREDRRHYREMMGQEERGIIERVCAREIEHFGYRF